MIVEHRILKLKTGETLCVAEMPWMESISLGVWAGVGGRHDPAELEGLAHFVEHMIFKGTPRRSARRLNLDVESVGGSMDAYTSEDHTAFYVRGPAGHFSRFADVLLDIYQHSKFEAGDVRKEREVIAEEISMYKEQPQQQAEDLLWQTAWPAHPLGRPIAGNEDSLKRINHSALRRHASDWFGRKNSVIAIAGRITAEEARKVLEGKIEQGLPVGKRPAQKPFKPGRRRVPVLAVDARKIDQVQLGMAFHTDGRLAGSAPALRLLNVMLGENTSSRLWSELREARGLCYDASSDLTSLHDTGLLHIFAGVDPEKLHQSVSLILRELRRFAMKPVSGTALRAASEYAIGSSRMAAESPVSQMTSMAECLLFFGRYVPQDQVHARLRTVTPADVQALARRIFQPGNLHAVFVGPAGEEAALAKLLRAGLVLP